MSWPWASRGELEAVREERDRLREREDFLLERIDHLSEQIIRLVRVRHGRPEMPVENKSNQEPMPESILELVRGFERRQTQLQLLRYARAQKSTGRSWTEIKEELNHRIAEGMIQ